MDPYSTVSTHINMWLVDNNIREVGASHIAGVLNTVCLLCLGCNSIGDKGLQTIFNSLKTLKVLQVVKCCIYD